MRLTQPFARLPIRFCAETLTEEVRALPEEAWVPHPTGYKGNDAALLITPGGGINQGFIGEMKPTRYLAAAPYIQQVMAEIGCVWGRSRLMGLAPGAQVAPHVDTHYHWRTHWRLHIPILTTPDVRFTCAGEIVHMAPGECWTFDSFQLHEVHNDGPEKRIHLVLDTVGGGKLFDLLAAAQSGNRASQPKFIAPDGQKDHPLKIERHNVRRVMSPWEMQTHIAYLLDMCPPSPSLDAITHELDRLVDRWTAAWAQWDEDEAGFKHYLKLVIAARDRVFALGAAKVTLSNGLPLFHCLRELVFRMAVERPEQATFPGAPRQPAPAMPG
ncbi:aspartyl/asparaginyl beta-hydroxylase domain-containing protein [Altererythrobacter sp. GH1-8]|uniref:aspartyl/asparaginyl beta-hydroxylase domain-containing protein n=1 Tax=Altererythrobacter sp. GH1-8 TaxID=3349333 RepID=UPI00374D23BD